MAKIALLQQVLSLKIVESDIVYDRRKETSKLTFYIRRTSGLLTNKIVEKNKRKVSNEIFETVNIDILYENLPSEITKNITKEKLLEILRDLDVDDGKYGYYMVLDKDIILDATISEDYNIDIPKSINYKEEFLNKFKHCVMILPREFEKLKEERGSIIYNGFFLDAPIIKVSGILREIINGLPIFEITQTLNDLYEVKQIDEEAKNAGLSNLDKWKNRIISTLLSFEHITFSILDESKNMISMYRENQERAMQQIKKIHVKYDDYVEKPKEGNTLAIILLILIVILIIVVALLNINPIAPLPSGPQV